MRALFIEPWYAGSHAGFADVVTTHIDADWTCLTLPGRHWKWRMRGAAAWFATRPELTGGARYDVVLCTSYLALAELRGLVPALADVPTVLYFHENQLTYPVRDEYSGERDTHFGFTQLVSARVADACVFNSEHNRSGFLDAGADLLRRLPDAVPPDWIDGIRQRSSVVPVPVELPDIAPAPAAPPDPRGPLIVWNHRWEYDKGPDALVSALRALAADDVPFRVAVCGEQFRTVPDSLSDGLDALGERVVHRGWLPSRADYLALLARADIALSTAIHEFFGVSMVEAAHHGARPLVPDRLAYPEIFPAEYRYADDEALPGALRTLCEQYAAGRPLRADRRDLTRPFAREQVVPRFATLLRELAGAT